MRKEKLDEICSEVGVHRGKICLLLRPKQSEGIDIDLVFDMLYTGRRGEANHFSSTTSSHEIISTTHQSLLSSLTPSCSPAQNSFVAKTCLSLPISILNPLPSQLFPFPVASIPSRNNSYPGIYLESAASIQREVKGVCQLKQGTMKRERDAFTQK